MNGQYSISSDGRLDTLLIFTRPPAGGVVRH
jgi:hypothetical protein